MQTYTLKVVNIKKETEDTVTLCFKQPGLKKIKYQAGQYLTLIFRINGRRYIRPYSFSSSPDIDTNLEVTVKRASSGIVSNHINDLIKVGDVIETLSPMGDFIVPAKEDHQSVFLWGAGSGITPLMSILKYLLHNKPQLKVNLIYGNRNKENTIFHDAIDDLKFNFPNSFQLWSFHTQLLIDEQLPDVIKGRIDPKKVLDTLSK
jgi:ring-1,2-phenylacetyl-CoA epoxidase subunit PaaE